MTVAGAMRLGRNPARPAPLPPDAALVGATSMPPWCRMAPGLYVAAELTPAGWNRLIGIDASRYANRIASLAEVVGAEEDSLQRPLGAAWEIARILDSYFLDRLERAKPLPTHFEALVTAVRDCPTASAEALREALGVGRRKLVRQTRTTFGFNP